MNNHEKAAWEAVLRVYPDVKDLGFECAGVAPLNSKTVLFDRDLPRSGEFEQILAIPQADGTWVIAR